MAGVGHPRRQGAVLSVMWTQGVLLTDINTGRSPILIATDVASRGLGTFSFSHKRCDYVSQQHGGRSCWCACCCRLRRRGQSRCSLGHGYVDGARQAKTSRARIGLPPDLAQFPLTFYLHPATYPPLWVRCGMRGSHSMNSCIVPSMVWSWLRAR